jgi:hypothetical protein
MQLVAGHTIERLPVVRELFVEYANTLGLDFCFQNFDQELAELPGKYAPPSGRLFLALSDGQAVGCGHNSARRAPGGNSLKPSFSPRAKSVTGECAWTRWPP